MHLVFLLHSLCVCTTLHLIIVPKCSSATRSVSAAPPIAACSLCIPTSSVVIWASASTDWSGLRCSNNDCFLSAPQQMGCSAPLIHTDTHTFYLSLSLGSSLLILALPLWSTSPPIAWGAFSPLCLLFGCENGLRKATVMDRRPMTMREGMSDWHIKMGE